MLEKFSSRKKTRWRNRGSTPTVSGIPNLRSWPDHISGQRGERFSDVRNSEGRRASFAISWISTGGRGGVSNGLSIACNCRDTLSRGRDSRLAANSEEQLDLVDNDDSPYQRLGAFKFPRNRRVGVQRTTARLTKATRETGEGRDQFLSVGRRLEDEASFQVRTRWR